mmetsp:Transcript_41349/g.81553  ORF Transcript_41349/g.81553 Transcript_41349/m.81553 type:complete len:321 (+) Transcript_41349:914-1876(+)
MPSSGSAPATALTAGWSETKAASMVRRTDQFTMSIFRRSLLILCCLFSQSGSCLAGSRWCFTLLCTTPNTLLRVLSTGASSFLSPFSPASTSSSIFDNSLESSTKTSPGARKSTHRRRELGMSKKTRTVSRDSFIPPPLPSRFCTSSPSLAAACGSAFGDCCPAASRSSASSFLAAVCGFSRVGGLEGAAEAVKALLVCCWVTAEACSVLVSPPCMACRALMAFTALFRAALAVFHLGRCTTVALCMRFAPSSTRTQDACSASPSPCLDCRDNPDSWLPEAAVKASMRSARVWVLESPRATEEEDEEDTGAECLLPLCSF